jgi:hypothetical protein
MRSKEDDWPEVWLHEGMLDTLGIRQARGYNTYLECFLFVFYSNCCRLLKVKKWDKKNVNGLCVKCRLSRTMTYHYQAVSSPSTFTHLLNVVCASEHLEKPVVLRRTIPLNRDGILVLLCRCIYLTLGPPTWGLASGRTRSHLSIHSHSVCITTHITYCYWSVTRSFLLLIGYHKRYTSQGQKEGLRSDQPVPYLNSRNHGQSLR